MRLHSITTVYIKCESVWEIRDNYKVMAVKAEKSWPDCGFNGHFPVLERA